MCLHTGFKPSHCGARCLVGNHEPPPSTFSTHGNHNSGTITLASAASPNPPPSTSFGTLGTTGYQLQWTLGGVPEYRRRDW